MTKCIVIGEQPTESKKKPIEFVKYLGENLRFNPSNAEPSSYTSIELIAPECYGGLDLIFAHEGSRPDGTLFLGHWNDGVAE